MNEAPHILCCNQHAANWRWLADRLDPSEASWDFVSKEASGHRALLELSWRAVRKLKRSGADLLVTHGPFLAMHCSVMRRLARVRAPQIAYSFHFDVDPAPAKQRLIARMCRGIDRFVVYSRAEIDVYHRLFDIPIERFEMIHWGIGTPEPVADSEPIVSKEYLCTIGGSARDYETFLLAASRVPDIPIAAVVRPHSLVGLQVPPNVKVFVNLPYDRMCNVLAHSRGVVIPLTPSARSGHSVLVLALHYGKAAIISDVLGVQDYLGDGQHAMAVPPVDPQAMATAMRRLWGDPEVGRSIGREGLRFAQERCTEEAVLAHFRSCLRRMCS